MRGKLLILSFAVLAVSCSTSLGETDGNNDVEYVSFRAEDFVDALDDENTKTLIINNNQFRWAATDTVGIYPQSGAQVFFTVNGGADAGSASFDGGGWSFKRDYAYFAYYPFVGDIYLDRHRIPVSFDGQVRKGTGDTDISRQDYMYTAATESEHGSLNFVFKHLCCVIRPNVTLQPGKYTKLAITAPSDVFAVEGYYDLSVDTPQIVGTKYTNQLIVDLEGINLTSTTTFRVYVMSAPVNLKDTEIIVSVLDDRKKEFQCKKTPSSAYGAGVIGGLTCSSFTEVPQSMGVIIDSWGDGGSYGGDAE